MQTMNTSIEDLIAQAEGKLRDLYKRQEELELEIRDAKVTIGAIRNVRNVIAHTPPTLEGIVERNPIRKKRRRLSPMWQNVVDTMSLMGSMTIDEIMEVAKVERDLVRNQMKYYKKIGLVTQKGDEFELTDAGDQAKSY